MELVTSVLNGRELIVALSGKVDSTNANAVELAVNEEVEKAAHESLVLDLDELEYLSSAGLRVILRLRKKDPSLKIINVSSDVYEIFDMTGFTELMPIEKAYRKISVDGCEVIGRGANGVVYQIDPDTIVKYYLNSNSLDDIRRESELARRAFVLGINTAIPYDVVKVGDGYGTVFERLRATNFAKLMNRDSDNVDTYIGYAVDLLKKMHTTEVGPEDMPDITRDADKWVRDVCPALPEETGKKLRMLVDSIPVRNTMIHGDYHVKNIMLQNGEVLLIDMDTLSRGNPIYEFAAIYSAYIGFGAFDESSVPTFLGISNELAQHIWKKTISLYFDTEDEQVLADIEKKAKLLSYMRIFRRSRKRGGSPESIARYKEELIRLVDEVDSLDLAFD